MKKIIFTLISCLLTTLSFADNSPIMVCNANGSTCSPFYNIDSAYNAANSGDYIYIPGGVFVLNLPINKEVHFMGAGSMLDSSMVTGITTLNCNITLNAGASNSSFEGFYLIGSLMGPTASAVNNITVNYCNISYFNGFINNSTIHASILRSGGYGDNTFYMGINNTISNCFISNISNLSSSLVINCTGIAYCNSLILMNFKNNIFQQYPYSPYNQTGGNNSWNNNVFVNSCPYYCLGFIFDSNNMQVSAADLFTNGFDYNNMHLVATSPALSAGENGTQAGVYGGLFPFKEGLVPSNPHIFQKNISASTDANGLLPIQIKARAENY